MNNILWTNRFSPCGQCLQTQEIDGTPDRGNLASICYIINLFHFQKIWTPWAPNWPWALGSPDHYVPWVCQGTHGIPFGPLGPLPLALDSCCVLLVFLFGVSSLGGDSGEATRITIIIRLGGRGHNIDQVHHCSTIIQGRRKNTQHVMLWEAMSVGSTWTWSEKPSYVFGNVRM